MNPGAVKTAAPQPRPEPISPAIRESPTTRSPARRHLRGNAAAIAIAQRAPAGRGIGGSGNAARVQAWPSGVQANAHSVAVSSHDDPAEREAERVARRVLAPMESTLVIPESPRVIARQATAMPAVPAPTEAEIAQAGSGGAPLPPGVRSFMEPRFGADFRNIRVHTDERAAGLATRVGARAFAYGRDVFFNRGQFRPETREGMELIAHELTHTIQQGAAPQGTGAPPTPARPAAALPAPASAAVMAAGGRRVQRDLLPDFNPFAGLAQKANALPGFRMLTLVLGVNPIDMAPVERNAANVIRAVIGLLVGGELIISALDKYGVIDKAGHWIDGQVTTLRLTGAAIAKAFKDFVVSLLTDFPGLDGLWDRAKRILTEPIEQIKNFVRGLIDGVIQFVRDAVLRPLADLASKSKGWDLLIAILGRNPITGEAVPPTAENLIGGFMKLIGQEEIWENLKKANAVARALAWYEKTKGDLLGFVKEFPKQFIATLKSFKAEDLLDLPAAFGRVATAFGDFAGRFIRWAGGAIWNLLEIIFDVVSPGALGYVKKTGAALQSILKNPIPFLGNLVKSAKLGLSNFAANIGEHLKAGLIDWLTGSLPGVYIPKALSLVELGKFALSVLGVTWAQIRAKIVKALGPTGETIMKGLETAFDVVVALVKGGPAAAWELIKEKLTNLKDMVIEGITSFVVETIVKKAIPKLIAMFIPGAGFISAILSIYDTIMVFVQKLAKIAAAVKAFVDSIVAIAQGQIQGAAQKVESTLAGLLSLAISFLAGFLGLGNIASKIMGVIEKVRAFIDKALDTAINFIVGKAKALFANLFAKDGSRPAETAESKEIKAKIRADLTGKRVADARQADELISGEYQKYSPKGLKGLRVVFDPKKPSSLIVLANASVTEEVANLPVTVAGALRALAFSDNFRFDNGSTILRVYYDTDHKFFAQVKNDPNREGPNHAEDIFAADYLGGLLGRISMERQAARLKTPAKQRVPVILNLNRLPCPTCSPLIARLSNQHKDIQFVVQASSASTSVSIQRMIPADSDMYVEMIEKMLAAEVQVEPLHVYDAIWRKIEEVTEAVGAGFVTIRGDRLLNNAMARRPFIEANQAAARTVEELIARAKAKRNIGNIPPRGSTP